MISKGQIFTFLEKRDLLRYLKSFSAGCYLPQDVSFIEQEVAVDEAAAVIKSGRKAPPFYTNFTAVDDYPQNHENNATNVLGPVAFNRLKKNRLAQTIKIPILGNIEIWQNENMV